MDIIFSTSNPKDYARGGDDPHIVPTGPPDSEVVIRIPAVKEEALARVVGLIHDDVLSSIRHCFRRSIGESLASRFSRKGPPKETVIECARCHRVDTPPYSMKLKLRFWNRRMSWCGDADVKFLDDLEENGSSRG